MTLLRSRFLHSRMFKPLLLGALVAAAFAVNADAPRTTSAPPVPLLWLLWERWAPPFWALLRGALPELWASQPWPWQLPALPQ